MPAKKTANRKRAKGLTLKELAEKIPTSLSSLTKWRMDAANNGCPIDSKDPADWREWMQNRTAKGGQGISAIRVDGKNYTAQDIIDLKAGLVEAQGRKENAMASLRELELERQQQSLVPESELVEIYTKTLKPLRKLLDSLPRQVATIANPTNPAIAEMAIRNYLDDRVFGELERVLEE